MSERDWPELPDENDLTRYDQYMTRDEARAIVAERSAAAEVANRRVDNFYETGALPRHRDLPDDALDQIRARNLGQAPPRPSLWPRLTGKA